MQEQTLLTATVQDYFIIKHFSTFFVIFFRLSISISIDEQADSGKPDQGMAKKRKIGLSEENGTALRFFDGTPSFVVISVAFADELQKEKDGLSICRGCPS